MMMNWIKDATKSVRNSLLTLDNQPVGRAALTIVIFLDIFIVVSIFNGLGEHTRQLTTPGEYIPEHCRDVVISKLWNSTNRVDRISDLANSYRERRIRGQVVALQHPTCQKITDLFNQIKSDRSLTDKLKTIVRLKREARQASLATQNVRGAYDTQLLETIAEVDTNSRTTTLKQEVTNLTNNLDSLIAQGNQAKEEFANDKKLVLLFKRLENLTNEDRENLAEEYRDLNFWYPVKKLGMEMLFLLPLMLIFYSWNSISIAKARPFQLLVSSHLLIVVFIPVLIKIFELLYEIIPKKLLQHIIEFLESIGLVAIWHYLVIAIGIAAAMMLIYLFQKKLFSQEKEVAKRISKGLCQNCGVKLSPESLACSQCGFEQFHPCKHCNEMTFVHGVYCRVCGQQQ